MSLSSESDGVLKSSWIVLWYFCAFSVLIAFNIAALTAVIPSISRSLNVSANDAAAIIPYYMIPYGVCALIYAPLASRFSIRHILIVAAVIYAISNMMCIATTHMPTILLGRVLSGIAAGAVTPLGLMTIGKIFPKDIRGRVLGLFFAASFAGSIGGLIVSGIAPWHWLFIIPTGLSFLLFVAMFFCPHVGMEANAGIKINYWQAMFVGGLRRTLILIAVMSLFFQGVCKWYGVYLDHIYGASQIIISGMIILTALAALLGQLIGGVITDKLGRQNACSLGIFIFGLCLALLFGHYSLIVVAIILSCVSVGWTIAHNGISTFLTDFPDEYRAELASLNSAIRFISGGVGFWISGNFMQQHFGMTFLVTGVLILLTLFFVPYVFNHRR